MSSNPLMKHFRRPAIHLKLPSRGKFWSDNALELPVTGDIPVYPMTSGDEIALKTPDALMNGSSIVTVIQSCCPNIKDAWQMPSIDVDSVLLYIRIASYGNQMDFDTECPKCKEENNFAIDLGMVVGNIAAPDYESTVDFDHLRIKLKPQPYFEINKANQIQFTQQQILRTVNDSSMSDEDKKERSDAYLKELINLNIEICVNCTREVVTEEGVVVTDKDFIREFYDNADYKVLKKVQDVLADISSTAGAKPIETKCTNSECGHEYAVPLAFDYANFFG